MAKRAFQLHSEININASVEQVWSVFMDFEKYPEWNPFILSITGEAKKGETIQAILLNPGSSKMKFTPKVLSFDPGREFRWLGHLFFPGLFDGEHYFQFSQNLDGSTRFVQGESFRGILVPLLKNMLNTKTQKGFELMNAALKERVEKMG